MQVNPYLTFNGQCAEAIKFYERVLGGKVTFQQTWGESPMAKEMPAETHDKIMHATVDLDGATLMCADSPPDHYQAPRGIHITLHFNDLCFLFLNELDHLNFLLCFLNLL